MSLTLIRDPDSQNCINHIDMMYYHIQELVENKKLDIK